MSIDNEQTDGPPQLVPVHDVVPPATLRAAAPDSARTGTSVASLASGELAAVSDDVIDVEAVARLMKVGRNTVYAMVGRNQIPHRRLGKQIRFHREAVMRWLASWSSQGAKEGH